MSILAATTFKLKHYRAKKLKEEVRKIIGKHLDLSKYRVFIFGSRINGRNTDRSDIDVGIEGPAPIPPRKLADIKEEIDNLSTLYTIEVVDFKKIAPKFKAVAKKHIEVIS